VPWYHLGSSFFSNQRLQKKDLVKRSVADTLCSIFTVSFRRNYSLSRFLLRCSSIAIDSNAFPI